MRCPKCGKKITAEKKVRNIAMPTVSIEELKKKYKFYETENEAIKNRKENEETFYMPHAGYFNSDGEDRNE